MMAARILKHKPESEQGRFYHASEHVFNKIIEYYGHTLKFVLRFQTITLLVAVGTLGLTVYLFYDIPKGFFPIQDTGVIQGITEAAPVRFVLGNVTPAASRLAASLLKDPAVESLSSFIGVDGTNTTTEQRPHAG